MKWETVKNRCVSKAYEELNNVYSFSSIHLLTIATILDTKKYKNVKYIKDTTLGRALRKEIIEEIVKAIDNWDIRQYNQLKKVFPDAFPKNLYGIIEFTDKGWEII